MANKTLRSTITALVLFAGLLISCSQEPQQPYELHLAAQANDLNRVKKALAAGANVNEKSPTGATPLHLAAQDGHDEIVALLLQSGANPDLPEKDGWHPLHLAAKGGHQGTVVLLLSNGASPNATNAEGGTPLHSAAEGGNTDIVRLLINRGAKVDVQFKGYFTPLHIAVEHRNFAAADLLVKSSAPVSLHLAAALGDAANLAQHLLTEGADVQDLTGNTALHYFAVSCGDQQVGEQLRAAGANVNARNRGGATPLHSAVYFQNRTATEFLMKNGADPHASDSLGNTPLSLANAGADRKIQELVNASERK